MFHFEGVAMLQMLVAAAVVVVDVVVVVVAAVAVGAKRGTFFQKG